MAMTSTREAKKIAAVDLFPGLSETELKEAQEALDGYAGIVLQIFTRLERERREPFDGPTTAS
jgi:hypothetical protein